MGGKSGGDPKMRVTRYYLSGHWGICQGPVDAVKAIWVGEKKLWTGNATENGTVVAVKEKLFGGMKKEGGASGNIAVMLGGDDQTPPPALIQRLKQPASRVPGFRGITSLFFYGRGSNAPGDFNWGGLFGMAWIFGLLYFKGRSFYWGTQPYLKPIWVTVQRIPERALAPATAPIPRTPGNSASIYFCLDDSGSMSGTKTATLKSAVGAALDLIEGSIDSGFRMDVGVTGFNGGSLERPNATLQDIADIRTWVNALGASGGTPFNVPISRAVDWFEATKNDGSIFRRVLVFITDGVPNSGTDVTAADDASHLLDRTIPVDMYGVNIELEDTSHTALLDNTPEDGVPVVTGDDPGPLIDVINTALAGLTVPEADANPAHIIYECLIDTDWGMGADPDSIDTASFQSASARLWGEGFGLFLQWQAQSSIEDFINDVLEHIRGAIFPHPRTGKMTLRLLRDDLDIENLPEITPDNASMANFSRKGWGETVNEIVVTWTRPETEKDETIRMQDLANIAQQGGVISSSKNYHGIRTASLATRVAERDLREESAPLSACEVEVNREFWDTVPFDGVKMTWPEYGLSDLVMRVMKVNYGDSSSSVIKLSLMEDVFSLSPASFVAPAEGEWQEPGGDPLPVTEARLTPAPAYVVSNNGVDPETLVDPATALVPLPSNPTTDEFAHYDVLEQVTTASGDTVFEEATGDRPFPGEATLDAELVPGSTSTGVLLAGASGPPAAVDELIVLGDAALPVDELELALVTAVDANTGSLTLLRGVLDTVPKLWQAGTTVTITTRAMWRLLPREYTAGQSVTLRFLTSTATAMLEDYEAPDFVDTALARASMPLRPANVTLDGQGVETPEVQLDGDQLVFAWSHRNRLLEDTVMYAWDAASTPLEAGVTYRVESDAYDANDDVLQADWLSVDVGAVDTHTVDLSVDEPPAGWIRLRFRVVAERDGERNWQAAELTVTGIAPPGDITAEYVPVFAPRNVTAEVTDLT